MGSITRISYKEAIDFIMPRHYAGRKPQICRAYGWVVEDVLVAVCSFGKPASKPLCEGILGKEYSRHVYELNRLCRVPELNTPLSQFVSACLRDLRSKNWIVVSYSDTGMNHNGYIYQACNFLYTGATKERTDKYTVGNKHSRHYTEANQTGYRKIRTAKHRYVYFCTGHKKLKKEWRKALRYSVEPYPKGINRDYILGEYQVPIIVPEKQPKGGKDGLQYNLWK